MNKELNKAQRDALDIIENFILHYTSDGAEYERMKAAAFDYVEQDHVLREQQEPQKKRVNEV